MRAYERMISLLRTTGLYRLDGSTAVERELRVWADYFDQLAAEIAALPENAFPETMDRTGFDNYRRLYSLPQNIGWAELRGIVERRLGLTNRDFTKAGVQRCMASGGFTVELTEDFANRRVTVHILEDQGAFGAKPEKEAFLQSCLPAHAQGVFVW